MTGLVPFNRKSTGLLNTGFEDFYNMLDDFFSDNWSPRRSLEKDTFKINVQQNETEYLVEAELPGVSKDEINVDLNENRLTISVKREEKINEEKKNYIHRESRYCFHEQERLSGGRPFRRNQSETGQRYPEYLSAAAGKDRKITENRNRIIQTMKQQQSKRPPN